VSAQLPWAISGTYLEACNCEVICPCRRIGGRPGGRSTTGTCFGALSWSVREGHAHTADLSGLGVVLAFRYEDDEPGSPWTYALYVDERGSDAQRQALADVFTGELGGSSLHHFPWTWEENRLLGWRPAPIAIEHAPRRGWFRAGGSVTVSVGEPVRGQEPVSCVIPGHERSGAERHADELRIEEGELSFAVHGRCAYESTFAYGSADTGT